LGRRKKEGRGGKGRGLVTNLTLRDAGGEKKRRGRLSNFNWGGGGGVVIICLFTEDRKEGGKEMDLIFSKRGF